MSVSEQWRAIEAALGEGWGDAHLRLRPADASTLDRAAALLAPLNPWRVAGELRFFVVRRGAGARPEAVENAMRRLDRAGIAATVELVAADEAPALPQTTPTTLAADWDAVLGTLPPDWSDLFLRLELESSDYLAPASLRLSPLNPRRDEDGIALGIRCASRFGYGGSPGMTRRCLERCDADGIRGELRVLRVLCDTIPVATQGPVFFVGDRNL